MNKHIYNINMKFISLTLSGILIFQSSAPAWAFSYGELLKSPQALEFDKKMDKLYTETNNSSSYYESVLQKGLASQKEIIKPLAERINSIRRTGARANNNDLMLTATYVNASGRNVIEKLSDALKSFLRGFYVDRSVMPLKAFEKEYNAYISSEVEKFLKENPSSNKTKAEDITKEVKRAFPLRDVYAEYKSAAEKELQWYKDNKSKVDEVAYQILRDYVKAFGVNMNYDAARLLINLKINGKPIVTEEEKRDIYDYVLFRIKKTDIKSIFDIGFLSFNKKEKAKTGEIVLRDMTEMMILGAYVRPNNDSAYPEAIKGLIRDSLDTPAFPHFLNAGFSSLLYLRLYDDLGDMLSDYSKIEAQGKSLWDSVTFQFVVDTVNETQGSYLRGKPSKNAQYATEYGYRNAFEDIAALLAEEGSEKSLKLLKTYGADSKQVIMPFLVGAVLSGKSGAARNQNAAKMKMTPNEYLAMKIANISLGDITATQESDIDKTLLAKYPNIKSHLGTGAVVNEKNMEIKKRARVIYDYASRAATAGDIVFMIWATFDLLKLAGKAMSLGKATYTVFKLAKITDPALRVSKVLGNMSKIKSYVSARKALRGFSSRIKGAISGVVIGQRPLYTSAPLPSIAGSAASETTLAKTLTNVSVDATTGSMIVDKYSAYKASEGNPNRVIDIMNTQKTLDIASAAANEKYFSRNNILRKVTSYKKTLAKATLKSFRNSEFIGKDFETAASFAYALKKWGRGVKAPLERQELFKWGAAASEEKGMIGLYYRNGETDLNPVSLPITIKFDGKKIPNVELKAKEEEALKGLLTKKQKKRSLIKWFNGKKTTVEEEVPFYHFSIVKDKERSLLDPFFFKIALEDNDFAQMARLSLKANEPIDVKFVANGTSFLDKFLQKSSDLFSTKKTLFPTKGTVFVEEGGVWKQTPITLSASRRISNLNVRVRSDNTLEVIFKKKSGDLFSEIGTPYSFYLPKGQLGTLAQYSRYGNPKTPIHLTLSGSRNKIKTLYGVQFLSLSAASTGLIGPLRQNYPEMSNTQESLITVALPYLPSFLSSFWAPFVKRFGSTTMMKASLGLAAASLTLSTFSGFNGMNEATLYNLDKPSLTPLLFSAGFIGLSSSLTRASFNELITTIGGGGGYLRSMFYKNAGSFAMLAPTLFINLFSKTRYYTDTGKIDGKPIIFTGESIYGNDGSLIIAKGAPILDKDGGPLKHHKFDFSICNPFLLLLTGGIFLRFHTARFSPEIGLVEGYRIGGGIKPLSWLPDNKFSNFFNANIYQPALGLFTETINSTKVLFREEVWPITLAGFGALGVEASMLNKYSQNEANNYLTNSNVGSSITRPIIATALLVLPQASLRIKPDLLVKKLGRGQKESPLGYKRLMAISMASAAAGVGLLSVEDNFWTFLAGASLVGIGFANTTAGFLMLGMDNLRKVNATKALQTDWKASYPAVHIGMSALPLLHNFVADKDVEKDPENTTKIKALQDNIWIPGVTLGVTILSLYKGVNFMNPSMTNNFIAPLKHASSLLFYPYFIKNWDTKLSTPVLSQDFAPVDFNTGYGNTGFGLNNTFNVQPHNLKNIDLSGYGASAGQ